MSNTMIYKVAFIDNDFYTNIYNTAFLQEWDDNNDDQKGRFIEVASTRIKSLSSRPFVDLDDLEQEQADGVKTAVARLVDYWMEYGLDLNRVSGSVSLGSFSASQTAPADPDYIPRNVYDILQDVGLYSPVGFVTEEQYRFDDDRELTYGVRFETLERIKDVRLEKLEEEASNKDLSVMTSSKILDEIRIAKLSPFAIIGDLTYDASQTLLPTSDEINFDFLNGGLKLDNGLILVSVLSVPAVADERLVVQGEAVRIKLQDNTQEVTDYDGSKWEIDSSNNALKNQVNANALALTELNGLTQLRAIKAVEGDTRYLRTDGSNEMSSGYTPANDQDVMTKGLHDADTNGLQAQVTSNKTEADDTLARVTTLEPLVSSNSTTSLDYINNKADFVRVEDITGAIEVDFSTPIIMTEDGQDVVADLSGVSAGEITTLNTFVNDRLVTIQAYPNAGVQFPVEYARDSWNNGMSTANVILGRDITVETTWTADGVTPVVRELRISGLTNPDRPNFIRDFTITSISQLGGAAGAGIDATARTTATAAQATAISADSKATAATADVIALTTQVSGKQDSSIPGTTTTAKTVEGAIRELDALAKSNKSDVDEIDTSNLAALELKLGV